MTKLIRKPWNDPWTLAANRDPAYRAYCFGTRRARSASWRRLTKAARKFETGERAAGALERAVFRHTLAVQPTPDYPYL